MKESEIKGIAATAKAVEDFYRSHCINVSAHMFELKEEAAAMQSEAQERERSILVLNSRIQELERENTDLKEENSKMLEALNSSAGVGSNDTKEVTN